MDPAELLKPINDRPIAAVRIGFALSPEEWRQLVQWLQYHGRRVVLVGYPLYPARLETCAVDLDLRGTLAYDELAELLFWCCLCIGPDGPVLAIAREKAVPVIVADVEVAVLISRIEALWHRQDEEARALSQSNA